jgi:chromosomal replication initiator protein
VITIEAIQRATATHYGIPFSAMRQPSGDGMGVRRLARPRQVAMCLSYTLTNHGLTRVGHFFGGRDRKTVYTAHKLTQRRAASDPALYQAMRRITLDVVGRAA